MCTEYFHQRQRLGENSVFKCDSPLCSLLKRREHRKSPLLCRLMEDGAAPIGHVWPQPEVASSNRVKSYLFLIHPRLRNGGCGYLKTHRILRASSVVSAGGTASFNFFPGMLTRLRTVEVLILNILRYVDLQTLKRIFDTKWAWMVDFDP